MKSIDEAEARARLDEVLEEAQHQPIAICRQAQAIAVVVPIAEYERLHGLSVQAFLALRGEIANEAESSGLTPEQLAAILREV